MDFVEGLPKSDGSDTILVVVGRFTKSATFLGLKYHFAIVQVARAVLDNVIKICFGRLSFAYYKSS
jgi:hypothetical protein